MFRPSKSKWNGLPSESNDAEFFLLLAWVGNWLEWQFAGALF